VMHPARRAVFKGGRLVARDGRTFSTPTQTAG
jgi:hypothetical protein